MEISEIPRNTYTIGVKSPSNIGELGQVKVDSLREAIREIQTEIAERMKISDMFDKEGEKMKRDIKNFLFENAPKGDDDSEFTRERAELRRKSVELNEMQLNEKVECWRDIVALKKDLREKQKELFERENRVAALNSILEE